MHVKFLATLYKYFIPFKFFFFLVKKKDPREAGCLGMTAKDVLFCWHLLGIFELHGKAKLYIGRIDVEMLQVFMTATMLSCHDKNKLERWVW